MALVLAMSYAIWFGIDPVYFGAKATDMYAIPSNPTVFRSHITHNFFLVVAIYLWLLCFFRTEKPALKGVYAALALLGLVNLFGMIDGRTGWLVFMVIPLYFGYQKLGLRGFLLAGLYSLPCWSPPIFWSTIFMIVSRQPGLKFSRFFVTNPNREPALVKGSYISHQAGLLSSRHLSSVMAWAACKALYSLSLRRPGGPPFTIRITSF